MQDILERVPGARLAFVGDGPAREELKQYFAGTPTVFMGAHWAVCWLHNTAAVGDLSGMPGAVPSCRPKPSQRQIQQLVSQHALSPDFGTGMMHGEELSAAYASADIFVMPSETETLGEHVAHCWPCALLALLQSARSGCVMH